MSELLEQLNKKQREAADTIDGQVLVLAGAGSGKTRTLTYRIANMIKNKGIRPSNILAVTFTNKASGEMKERVNSLLDQRLDLSKIDKPWHSHLYQDKFPMIGTFHAFGLRVLKEDIEKIGMKPNFSIIDPDEQLLIIKKIIKEMNLGFDRINPKAIQSKVSGLKNDLIYPFEAKKKAYDFFDETAAQIYEKYQKHLFKANLVDFDDIIMHTLKIWSENKEILEKYQDRYPYIMVDEYQDTNDAQYQLVNLLAKRNKNVFVVGDDYQSIYAWRGANINNILNFEKDYPDAKIILLEQNYRSTQNILNAAQYVIENNSNQKPKKLWTENDSGALIKTFEAADEEDETLFIIEEIRKLRNKGKEKGLDFSNFAILYRINAQSRAIEEVLLKNNIPYRIVGGIKFYQRAEIKDIIAYLRLISNFGDVMSFERIINIPRRKLGKVTVSKAVGKAVEKGLTPIEIIASIVKNKDDFNLKLGKNTIKSLRNFYRLIIDSKRQSKKLDLKQLISYIVDKSGYKSFLISGGEEGKTRYENVMELLSVAEKFSDLEPEEALSAFLDEVSLATSEENPGEKKDAITLMTLHSAKGLEYEYVFIAGFEEGVLPHSRSLEAPAEMEEERRLCYVGITRAMKRLWLIYTRNRQMFGQVIKADPSRFLIEIGDDYLEKHVSPPKINEYYDYPKTNSDFWEDDTIYF